MEKNQGKKKLSFWEKAMQMVTGGDEARMKSFTNENIAALTNQIMIRTAEISGLKTQIDEKDSHFIEAALKIDTTKIGTYKERAEYIKVYNKALSEILNEQDKLKAELETKNEEIRRFEKIRDLLGDVFDPE